MTGIVFRLAVPADVEALAALAGELGHPTSPAELGPRLTHLAADPEQAVLVAEEARRVVGWIHVREFHALTSAPSALVVGLVVAVDARGRGLGSALLARAEAWARARGLASMRLRARRERRAAHAFYRARGYRVLVRQLQFRKDL